ncbi:MAG TPA: hypothetical protein PLZ55_17170 [bacterium]|nr:hypothetical protein [bacterium]
MNQILCLMIVMTLLQACDDKNAYTGFVAPEFEDEDDECGHMTTESIGWEEPLDNGPSPSARLSDLEGECVGLFSWAADVADGIIVSPMSGESVIHVTVAFAHDQIYLTRYDASTADSDRECPSFVLYVPVTLSLATENGVLVDEVQDELAYSDLMPSPLMLFLQSLEETGGTLQVDLPQGATGSLLYRTGGSAGICSGSVMLWTMERDENGILNAGTILLGSWQPSSSR